MVVVEKTPGLFDLYLIPMEEYLQASQVIDWQHPTILELAQQLAANQSTPPAIAKACFEWVRDQIRHSVDFQMNPVTCRASEVLQHRTGFCYAKSHLLAALLRANNIPAGFCYQRLSIDDQGAPYCLHGFNAIYLPEVGWYRVDPRGDREGIQTQFAPPQEQLAYQPRIPGEVEFQNILSEPLAMVVQALQTHLTLDELRAHLPDVSLESLADYGLVLRSDECRGSERGDRVSNVSNLW